METKGTCASSYARAVRIKTGNYFKWLCVFAVTSALLLSSVISGYSAQATLAWDAVSDAGVAGYKLHYGKVPGVYTNSVDTGKTTSLTVNDLTEGETYYFVSTAYDSKGNQSGYSNEVSKSLPSTTQYSLMVAQNGSGTGTVTGSGINCGNVCTNGYAPGTVVKLTANPASASTFTGWSGGGCSGTGTCTVTMNASTSITATFNSSAVTYDITATASGSGTITALNNPNVSQGTSGSSTVSIVNITKGVNQQFSITPNTGNYTASVSVDGSVVATNQGSYTYTFSNVTANHTISATFAANPVATYSISSSAGAGGSISPAGSVSVNSDGSQGYTITPASGYKIAGVTVDGVSVGAVPTYIFSKVTANHTISATFAENSTSSTSITSSSVWQNQSFASQSGVFTASFDMIPNAGDIDGVTVLSAVSAQSFTDGAAIVRFNTTGSIDARNGSSYAADVAVPYTAGSTYHVRIAVNVPNKAYDVYVTPLNGNEIHLASGYAFRTEQATVSVLNNLAVFADVGSYQMSNFAIAAQVQATSYSISASAGMGGSISPSASVSVSSGGSNRFVITPDNGYQIKDVTVDGTSVGAVSSYTFSNVTSNHTISAAFTNTTSSYTISASAARGGSISPEGTVPLSGGASKSFTIVPNYRYSISDVKVDGVSKGAISSYTFSNIAANHTIQADFSRYHR